MNTHLMSLAFAAAASVTISAQAPQSAPTPQPPDRPSPTITQTPTRATPANPVMTISGCLQQREPGRTAPPANTAERAAMVEDYILSNVKMSPGSTVEGIGVSTKYEVRGIIEAELKKHLNHQVELVGQIVRPDTEKPADDTPDFLATTLKMLSVTCNAAQ